MRMRIGPIPPYALRFGFTWVEICMTCFRESGGHRTRGTLRRRPPRYWTSNAERRAFRRPNCYPLASGSARKRWLSPDAPVPAPVTACVLQGFLTSAGPFTSFPATSRMMSPLQALIVGHGIRRNFDNLTPAPSSAGPNFSREARSADPGCRRAAILHHSAWCRS
jgi:hypothetical protein